MNIFEGLIYATLFWPCVFFGLVERMLRAVDTTASDISIRCEECRKLNAKRDRRFLRVV